MTQFIDIAFPAYVPDQSSLSGGLEVARNVLPAVDGYRSVGATTALSDALPAPFTGGASFIASNGTAYLLAGTATGLYSLTSGTWTALRTGLTGSRWRFAQFGDYAVAVTGGPTQVVDLTAGTASALTDAPSGRSIAVVGDYVVIGQAGGNLLKVQWSAFNNHTGWTPGLDQSGFQPMLTGGEVMGVAGGEYGVILQRQRLVRMDRTGDGSAPFAFSEITPNVGCASRGSIAQAGRTVFFLSDRGFMALDDGQVPRPIGDQKVDATFKAMVNRDDYERIYSAVDPERNLVFWTVPGAPATTWVYHWALDRWSTLKFPAQGVMAGFSASISLDALDGIYGDLDDIPYSLDDPRFSGGAPRLYFADWTGALGTLQGPTLEAQLELSNGEPVKGRRARVVSAQLIGDVIEGAKIDIGFHQRIGDTPEFVEGGALRSSGIVPLRGSGRYLAPRVTISAGAFWSYVQGIRLEIEPGAMR